ncbi:MAG: MBL fold metallo-hydrolase [Candidatus Nanoarchaeia archaeon]|jgi:glyoxylase-like metal-dependent hydrolase (beta-lactamase superfamily II)
MDLPEKIKLFEGTCNTYLIDDKVKVLVDAGFDYDGKVDIVLITHGHSDHLSALKAIMERNQSCIVYLSIKDLSLFEAQGFIIDDRFRALYEGKTKIETGSYTFNVIDVPAHTKGCVAFWDEAKRVLFSGDTIFKEGPGRTDLPESIPDFVDIAIILLLGLDAEIILPGHGESFKPDEYALE